MSDQVLPTLDELAADPMKAGELPAAMAARLLARLAGLQTVLLGRLLAGPEAIRAKPEPEGLLTMPDVAARLRVPVAFAYELARRGDLPTVRVGVKYVRVPAAALAEWVERQRDRLDTGGPRSHSPSPGSPPSVSISAKPDAGSAWRTAERASERGRAMKARIVSRPRGAEAAPSLAADPGDRGSRAADRADRTPQINRRGP